MSPLPVLISIPHSGNEVPEEILELSSLTPGDIFDEGDAFTYEIYNLGALACSTVITTIARSFIDVNRAPDDLPPDTPDGVLKSITTHKKEVYQGFDFFNSEFVEQLLHRYYWPYHKKIAEALINSDIKIAFDCHSMAPVSPPVSKCQGRERPLICLGNAYGKAASQEIVLLLADCFMEVFNLNNEEVMINDPFPGGYITRVYGYNPVPWIQIEINKNLYLRQPDFDSASLSILREPLLLLKEKFKKTLLLFLKRAYDYRE